MNGSPAFRFYAADYLADEKVQSMSIEGEGCYVRLLCYCWREGSIPAEREAIVRLCKGYNGPGIDEALACFSLARNLQRFTHKRLDLERRRQVAFAKSCRDRGLSGANKRWLGHSPAIATPIAKNGSSSSSSSSLSIREDKSLPLSQKGRGKEEYKASQIGKNTKPIPPETKSSMKRSKEIHLRLVAEAKAKGDMRPDSVIWDAIHDEAVKEINRGVMT